MEYKYIVNSVEQTQQIAKNLAAKLQKGDLIMLSGGLGAGKTTFTKGLGQALNVKGQVSSPTFIVARVHPSLCDGVDLIHVDAYRIDSLDDLETLDLDSSIDCAVTVVEWGDDKVENLSACRLEIRIDRKVGDIAQKPCALDVDGALGGALGSVAGDSGGVDNSVALVAETESIERRVTDLAGTQNPIRIIDLSEADDGEREITIKAVGSRWENICLSSLL